MTLVEHYLLPATLFLLMFAMGLSLTLANFVDVFRYRTALVVGVASPACRPGTPPSASYR